MMTTNTRNTTAQSNKRKSAEAEKVKKSSKTDAATCATNLHSPPKKGSVETSPPPNAWTTVDNRNHSARGGDDPATRKLPPSDDGSQTSMATDTTDKVHNTFTTRISVNFFVPPSENEADKKLYSAAQKWMVKMSESDKTIALLPWYDSDMGENIIHTYKDIPTSLFLFKKYFQRANPNEKGGKVYTDLFLLHAKPIEEIKGDMSWWLRKEKIDIYVKEIQSEATSRLGWLLFSFGEIHIKTLMTEISLLTETKIAGRFKPVLEEVWDPTIDNKKRLKAVHLECARKDERSARLRLKKLYSTASTEYPLGIRMRLIPEYRDIKGNVSNIKKVANIRAKQAHFLKALENDSTDDIMNLDVTHSTLNLTLREMIMSIQSWGDYEANLFHGINQSWKGNKITFSFLPMQSNAAKMIIDGIIPFIRSKYGDEALDFFVPEAVDTKSDWSWDDEKKVIINPMSKDLAELDEADADYNFVPATTEGNYASPTNNSLTPSHRTRLTLLQVIWRGL